MKYLVKNNDWMCIVYPKEIVVENKNASLNNGDLITFFWSENMVKPKKFTGTIVEKSGKYNLNSIKE